MRVVARGYVGKKGEIYIEKRIRELAGLRPGDDLVVFVRDHELVVRRIPRLSDILGKKALAVIDVEEIERISEEEQRRYMV